jgi:ZIP family zinc transporter
MFTEQATYALLLSLFAGLSTLLGTLIVFFIKDKNKKIITFALAFAAGVMISVSFSDLLPEAQMSLVAALGKTWGILSSILFLILGILLAAAIDLFVPHGEYEPDTDLKPHQDLFRVGFVSMLAMILHNFPEGIATFMAGYNDLSLGVSIALAIALHNIPEGISIAMPIYYATGSRWEAFKYTFWSGLAEPLGALLAFSVLRPYINDVVLGASFALVAGIMLYISFEELLPSSRSYGYQRLALISTFVGICIMPLSHIA